MIATKGFEFVRLWEVASARELFRLSPPDHVIRSLAVSPNDRFVVTGGVDGTIAMWDLAAEWTRALALVDAPRKTNPDAFDRRWADLADDDPATAYRTIEALIAAKQNVGPLLKKQIEAVVAERKEVRRLIAKLGSDQLRVSQNAATALKRVAATAEDLMRETQREPATSLELHFRIGKILDELPPRTPAVRNGAAAVETLRIIRAILVIEHLDAIQAKEILHLIVNGAFTKPETDEARFALERLLTNAGRRP